MIVYHGSNRNFKTLRISQSLVRYDSTLTNEGIGIYFSTDRNVSESYGKYLYTLELNDKYFKDFRKKTVCQAHLKGLRQLIYKSEKLDLANYIDLSSVANYMYFGGISIYRLSHEIELLLDSNEQWYRNSQSKIQRVYRLARQWDKNNLAAYMFNYNIKNVGVIKRVEPDIVRIASKIIV